MPQMHGVRILGINSTPGIDNPVLAGDTGIPKPTLMRIVTAYHNLSDGFGLSLDEFREILIFLSLDLRISSQALNLLIDDFYATLDTDNN
eukprot:gene48977-59960_t